MGWQVRATAAAAGLLAVAHGLLAVTQIEDTAYLTVLSGFAAVFGLVAAVRLGCANCLESRLVTTLIAASALLGNLLVAVVGLPGQDGPTPPSILEIAVVALACLTLLLLTLSSSRARLQPRRSRQNP